MLLEAHVVFASSRYVTHCDHVSEPHVRHAYNVKTHYNVIKNDLMP